MNLTTRYMGLTLKNPLVASASPLQVPGDLLPDPILLQRLTLVEAMGVDAARGCVGGQDGLPPHQGPHRGLSLPRMTGMTSLEHLVERLRRLEPEHLACALRTSGMRRWTSCSNGGVGDVAERARQDP